MANKDSDEDKQDQAGEQRDSDELELGKIDPLAGGYSEDEDARLVARILGEPPPPSPRLANRWVLLERLGSGGMGEVHAAFDLTLDCKVAIKFLRLRDGQAEEAARKRFVREAQAMAQMRKHPNVVQLYDAGAEGERVYLVMEHIDGSTLGEWQKERACDEIVAAYLQAGRGLAAIHAAGLVHRDFKPANAFVTVDEKGSMHVAVGDLGLAFATEAGGERPEGVDAESALHPAAPLTATGTQLGTLPYMAPEQLRGERPDARSDQFGFCVSLYEALCGRRPFDEAGTSPTALLETMRRGVPVVRQKNGKPLAARIERVLRRGLSMSVADRFPDMAALLAELAPRPRRAWPWVIAGMVAPALALALVFLFREQPCDLVADAELGQFWNPAPLQARLATGRMRDAKVVTLARAWEMLGPILRDQAQTWRQARVAICERERGTVPDGWLQLRRECLRKNRNKLEQVIRTWFSEETTSSAHPEERIADTAVELLRLRDCTAENIEILTSPGNEDFSAKDPAGQEALQSIGHKLALLEELHHQGKYEDARKLAHATVNELKTLGPSPVLAEARYRLGHVLTYLEEHEEGSRQLGDAADLAATYDMKALALDIWLYRVKHAAVDRDDTDLAQQWMPVTRHALRQTGDFDGKNIWQAEYEEALGLAASREGKRDDAREHHEKALEIRKALLGGTETNLIKLLSSKSLNNLANVERAEGLHVEAKQNYEEALALRQQALRPDHPLVGEVLFNLGLMAADRGDYQEAAKHLDKALGIEGALPVERISLVLKRLHAMGALELLTYDEEVKAGHQASAQEHFRRAEGHAAAIAALHRRLETEKPSSMSDIRRIPEHWILARVHELRQELPQALAELDAALHIHDREQDATKCGERQNEYRDSLVSAGYVLCELNRSDEARAYLEKAVKPIPSCAPDDTSDIRKRIQEEITRRECWP